MQERRRSDSQANPILDHGQVGAPRTALGDRLQNPTAVGLPAPLSVDATGDFNESFVDSPRARVL
jgi:hypothetical protein